MSAFCLASASANQASKGPLSSVGTEDISFIAFARLPLDIDFSALRSAPVTPLISFIFVGFILTYLEISFLRFSFHVVSFFVLSASNCSPALVLSLASRSFKVGAPPFAKRNKAGSNPSLPKASN